MCTDLGRLSSSFRLSMPKHQCSRFASSSAGPPSFSCSAVHNQDLHVTQLELSAATRLTVLHNLQHFVHEGPSEAPRGGHGGA